MDSFEINKILGALLFTCLCLLSLNIAAGAVFAPHKPAKPGFEVAVVETPSGAPAPAVPDEPIEKLLAAATIERGQASAKKCQTCHTFDKGGKVVQGPNLWGIVGRARASQPGFNYSAGMKAKGGNWTIEDINAFLTNPRGFVPGTTMGLAPITRGTERADIIAFLNSRADSPAPLPRAAEAAPAGTPKPQ